jgi:hypothetical protein
MTAAIAIGTVCAAPSAIAADERVWWVYRDAGAADNHGDWTNVTPAAAAGSLRIDLADRSRPASGETSVRMEFTLTHQPWCGIAVASASGYWGVEAGPAFELSGMRSLVFQARGQNGGERIRIKAGILGDQPFGDSAALPLDTGWLELTTQWRSYRVHVAERDLGRVVTPFAVIANLRHNPSGRAIVFFDDIRFEAGE